MQSSAAAASGGGVGGDAERSQLPDVAPLYNLPNAARRAAIASAPQNFRQSVTAYRHRRLFVAIAAYTAAFDFAFRMHFRVPLEAAMREGSAKHDALT